MNIIFCYEGIFQDFGFTNRTYCEQHRTQRYIILRR